MAERIFVAHRKPNEEEDTTWPYQLKEQILRALPSQYVGSTVTLATEAWEEANPGGQVRVNYGRWIKSLFDPMPGSNPYAVSREPRFTQIVVPAMPDDSPGEVLLGRATAQILKMAQERQVHVAVYVNGAFHGIKDVKTLDAGAWKGGWAVRY